MGDSPASPAMQVLFVHGMGRSSLSGWPLLWQLRRSGLSTATFDYAVSLQSFDHIAARLSARIAHMLGSGDTLVLIGHSLGGVLLREALSRLPAHSRQPRHVFLLGSPMGRTRMAAGLARNPLFRLFTGDCGQLLGSPERMASIGTLEGPATAIVGTRGLTGRRSPFGDEANDGIVAVSEVTAPWLRDEARLPVIHTFLPSSMRVVDVILQRLGGRTPLPARS